MVLSLSVAVMSFDNVFCKKFAGNSSTIHSIALDGVSCKLPGALFMQF
jgi:hypothetical protein